MQFTWDSLISRSRVYVDDDHNDTVGWIAPATWLTLGNVEYAALRKRWVRMGLINPPTVDATFTGFTTTITGVLATVGIARDYGGGNLRVLTPSQSMRGRAPFWNTTVAGEGYYWDATGEGDDITYTLEPRDTTSAYVVRYIPTKAYATAVTDLVEVPYGQEERLVLAMARRSLVKESAASRLLDGLIAEQDAEAAFASFGRGGDGPRVRRVPRNPLSRTPGQHSAFPSDPRLYRYA